MDGSSEKGGRREERVKGRGKGEGGGKKREEGVKGRREGRYKLMYELRCWRPQSSAVTAIVHIVAMLKQNMTLNIIHYCIV